MKVSGPAGGWPTPRKHRAQRHGSRSAETRGQADRIERGAGCEDQHGNADEARKRRREGERCHARAQKRPREQKHDQWLNCPDRGRDATWKPIGGHEEQHPEEREVERAENEDARPPRAARQLPHEKKQKQSGGKGAQERDEERMPAGQECRRHIVGTAPYRRRQRGQDNVSGSGHEKCLLDATSGRWPCIYLDIKIIT